DAPGVRDRRVGRRNQRGVLRHPDANGVDRRAAIRPRLRCQDVFLLLPLRLPCWGGVESSSVLFFARGIPNPALRSCSSGTVEAPRVALADGLVVQVVVLILRSRCPRQHLPASWLPKLQMPLRSSPPCLSISSMRQRTFC